jgi:hypothetical protein
LFATARLGQLEADHDQSFGRGLVVLRRDGQDLRLVAGRLGDDDERRRAISLDVELNSPYVPEWDRERNSLRRRYDEAPISHGQDGVGGTCPRPELLAGLKRV